MLPIHIEFNATKLNCNLFIHCHNYKCHLNGLIAKLTRNNTVLTTSIKKKKKMKWDQTFLSLNCMKNRSKQVNKHVL